MGCSEYISGLFRQDLKTNGNILFDIFKRKRSEYENLQLRGMYFIIHRTGKAICEYM